MFEYISEDYVARNRTKKNKTICPSCGGNDLGIKSQDRFAHCWECGANYRIGSEEDFKHAADRVDNVVFDTEAIRSLYSEAGEYYHSCLSADHIDYLHNRGIDDNAIQLFKIGFCPSGTSRMYTNPIARQAGLADSHGNPWLANRIVFPYIADGKITDLRGRALDNDEARYKSLYHRAERRGAVYPFNYDRALKHLGKTKTLILTEGEIKAIVADTEGFAIMALPGMLSFRSALVQQPGIRVVVAYDSTDKPEDKLRVDRAIHHLQRRIPEFYVVTLPLMGKDKMDVDLFLLLGGKDRFQHYIDNAVPYSLYKQLRAF